MRNHSLTVIDLFCGAGGLSEGSANGVHVLAGQDFDEQAERHSLPLTQKPRLLGGRSETSAPSSY